MTQTPEELKLCQNSEVIVQYIHKYIEKNDDCYDRLLKLKYSTQLENEFSDEQWALIIYRAWELAYSKAIEDNFMSPDERMELDNLRALAMRYVKTPRVKTMLSNRLVNNFRHGQQPVEPQYAERWKPPVPTPYDNIRK